MEIFIEKENKKLNLKFQGSGLDLLKKLNVNSEEVLMLKNEELITLEEKLTDSDRIKIISIISGG